MKKFFCLNFEIFVEILLIFVEILVNIFLIVLNLVTSPKYLWFFWPLLGWGIGVVFHGLSVFKVSPFFGKDWEERKMKQFLEEEKNNAQKWQ